MHFFCNAAPNFRKEWRLHAEYIETTPQSAGNFILRRKNFETFGAGFGENGKKTTL
jgi:hypothetical protein